MACVLDWVRWFEYGFQGLSFSGFGLAGYSLWHCACPFRILGNGVVGWVCLTCS